MLRVLEKKIFTFYGFVYPNRSTGVEMLTATIYVLNLYLHFDFGILENNLSSEPLNTKMSPISSIFGRQLV